MQPTTEDVINTTTVSLATGQFSGTGLLLSSTMGTAVTAATVALSLSRWVCATNSSMIG